MKKVIFYVMIILAVSFSQTVEWKTFIPFESEDDAPVGIDVAANGDIYVACYSNGPNTGEWVYGTDSLIHKPDTKIIILDGQGYVKENSNLGGLFNGGLKGMGLTGNSITLFGNHWYIDPRYVPGCAWMINYENSVYDTIRHDNSGFDEGRSFNFTKTSYRHEPVAVMSDSYSGLKSSSNTDRLMNTSNEDLLDYIDFPDSLFIDPEDKWAQFFYINDFDISENGEIYLVGELWGMYINYYYSFAMKLNLAGEVVWQKYFYLYDHPDSQHRMSPHKISSASNDECIIAFWDDLNENHDQDGSEYYIAKYDANGNQIFSTDFYENSIDYIHRIGANDFIVKESDTAEISKIRITGSEFITEWSLPLTSIDIMRPVENGFISAGVEGNNIVVRKVNATTGIDESNVIPSATTLFQNYPNPFNPVTQIKFALAKAADVKLSVYNISGQLVAQLASGTMNAGHHSVDFDGSRLNSGVYYYTLVVDGKSLTKRMLMVK